MAGIISPSMNSVPEPILPSGDVSAAVGPAAVNVRVAVPVLFATEMAATEHVAAGVTAGETAQVRVTVDGSSPPAGVIVTVDCADFPGAIEDGLSAPAEIPKSGAAMARFTADELLTVKLVSPL